MSQDANRSPVEIVYLRSQTRCRLGAIRGGPGQERLAHAAQQRGRGVVYPGADRASGWAGPACAPGCCSRGADQSGQDVARRVVAVP